MRWADQAFSNCCHDLTEKAYSPVEIGSRGNHALANIGDKTDSVRTAWRFRHGQRPVARFVEQDLIFRPDRFKPCIDALGIKSLAGPVDEPSPRRIEPHDPGPRSRMTRCAPALSARSPSARASIAEASTVQCPPRLSLTASPRRWLENSGHAAYPSLASASITTSRGNKIDINSGV